MMLLESNRYDLFFVILIHALFWIFVFVMIQPFTIIVSVLLTRFVLALTHNRNLRQTLSGNIICKVIDLLMGERWLLNPRVNFLPYPFICGFVWKVFAYLKVSSAFVGLSCKLKTLLSRHNLFYSFEYFQIYSRCFILSSSEFHKRNIQPLCAFNISTFHANCKFLLSILVIISTFILHHRYQFDYISWLVNYLPITLYQKWTVL